MASSLRLISSNFVTRRSVAPTLVFSASRFLSIGRSYTTMPKDNDSNDQSWLRIMCPEISRLAFEMDISAESRSLSLKIPRTNFSVDLDFPGLKSECGKHDTFLINGQTNKESFLAGIKLPNNTSNDDIKKEMKDGILLEVTPRKKDDRIFRLIANDIISSFCNINDEQRGWAYYDMFFDRSIIGERLLPAISMLSSIKSFSIHKEETWRSLEIKMNVPGVQRRKITKQDLCVSLRMPELHRHNVKAFFEYDTFFIEGKSWKHHYITCMKLPKRDHKKNNLIKTEVKGGVCYVTLSL